MDTTWEQTWSADDAFIASVRDIPTQPEALPFPLLLEDWEMSLQYDRQQPDVSHLTAPHAPLYSTLQVLTQAQELFPTPPQMPELRFFGDWQVIAGMPLNHATSDQLYQFEEDALDQLLNFSGSADTRPVTPMSEISAQPQTQMMLATHLCHSNQTLTRQPISEASDMDNLTFPIHIDGLLPVETQATSISSSQSLVAEGQSDVAPSISRKIEYTLPSSITPSAAISPPTVRFTPSMIMNMPSPPVHGRKRKNSALSWSFTSPTCVLATSRKGIMVPEKADVSFDEYFTGGARDAAGDDKDMEPLKGNRKLYRQQAEQKRRALLRDAFEEIRLILPNVESKSKRVISKEKLLDNAVDFIVSLTDAEKTKAEVIRNLELQIQALSAF